MLESPPRLTVAVVLKTGFFYLCVWELSGANSSNGYYWDCLTRLFILFFRILPSVDFEELFGPVEAIVLCWFRLNLGDCDVDPGTLLFVENWTLVSPVLMLTGCLLTSFTFRRPSLDNDLLAADEDGTPCTEFFLLVSLIWFFLIFSLTFFYPILACSSALLNYSVLFIICPWFRWPIPLYPSKADLELW